MQFSQHDSPSRADHVFGPKANVLVVADLTPPYTIYSIDCRTQIEFKPGSAKALQTVLPKRDFDSNIIGLTFLSSSEEPANTHQSDSTERRIANGFQ
jgi:hypothetical protein